MRSSGNFASRPAKVLEGAATAAIAPASQLWEPLGGTIACPRTRASSAKARQSCGPKRHPGRSLSNAQRCIARRTMRPEPVVHSPYAEGWLPALCLACCRKRGAERRFRKEARRPRTDDSYDRKPHVLKECSAP